MMFFVTERRLQAILNADRLEQKLLRIIEEPYESWDQVKARMGWDPFILGESHAVPLTPTQDARLVAKKAATKAARPVRKPREKK